MTKRIRSTPLAVAALGSMLLFGTSCNHNEAAPEVEQLSRDTPEHLIEAFAKALSDRNLDDYACLLDDSYAYFFMVQDYEAAGVSAGAPYWGKTEDVTSTEKMFGSTQVTDIICALNPAEPPACAASPCTLDYHPDIRVTVDSGDHLITYWVRETVLHFVLGRDRYDSNLWVILEMGEEERGASFLPRLGLSPSAVEPSTFGQIKAMFK
jgi:hypothetical protein